MRTIARPSTGLAALVVALGLVLATGGGAGATIHDRRDMQQATNASRDRYGVRDVRLNREMSALAREHSLRMARRGSLFHTTDPAGTYLRGVSWRAWGENVGVTPGTVRDLQRAFMASSPHRHNIVNGTFRRVAIGAVRVDGMLWVTVFFYG